MKRIALVLCAMATVLSGVNAMDSAQKETTTQGKEQFTIFVVQSVPTVTVWQMPYKQLIGLDNEEPASEINIQDKKFKDIVISGPLYLKYNMTKEQIADALFKAFGDTMEIKYEVWSSALTDKGDYPDGPDISGIFTKKK